ncbi:DUF2971 domain-containing protein [Edwardsiella tarda]|uniref:DUF2971 domain-containing protein n=1 Tax=Edwardsiella tarda TaxID=636 RepID=UPI00351C7EF8
MSEPTFFVRAFETLWVDVEEELSFPSSRPLLAHYTSIQTFEQIVTKEQFWFSNPLFMNDLEELRFGMNEGASELHKNEAIRDACRTPENYKKLLDIFDNLFNDFDSKHVLNTYILCFSEHAPDDNDGLLSMWRGYGNSGSGAALVIDTAKINENPESPMIIGKVHYASKDQRKKWISEKLISLADVISNHAKVEDDFFDAARAWMHRLKTFALFTKHHGFHEEREWRIVYMSDNDREQSFKKYFGHLATNRGIEPKLKLPIKPIPELKTENISLGTLVNRIILGPSVSSALAANSLRQMLRNIGQTDLAKKVVTSEIPFRPA